MNQLDGCVHRKFGTKVLEGLLCVCRVQERAQIAIRFARPFEREDREEVVFFGDSLEDTREFGPHMRTAAAAAAAMNSHVYIYMQSHTHTYETDTSQL